MSNIPRDNLDWALRLECPPSACSDNVKRILNRGILNYVWDELSSTIYPVNDVIETRKNTLLHYLNNQEQVPQIQQIYNTERLKAERSVLLLQIDKLKAECDKKDKIIQQRGLKLAKIQQSLKSVKAKKKLLELKYQEISTEMNHVKEMRSVCKNLLPAYKCEIDENTMRECLVMVGAISSRQDKHEAWKQISQNLGDIAVPELWKWIFQKRIEDTEKLVNLRLDHSDNSSKPSHRFAISVAKVNGQHIISAFSKLMHLKKTKALHEQVVGCMEQLLLCDANEYTQDWISLVLEVVKLEKSQMIIQYEIDQIKKRIAEEEDNLNYRSLTLSTDLHTLDSHMEECFIKIQKNFAELESASQILLLIKNNLMTIFDKIVTLHSQSNNDWLQYNFLISELEMFQDRLDMNALNKVMLRGRIGAHRHVTTCISNALTTTATVSSASPLYQAPLYHLIYCARNLLINDILQKRRPELDILSDMELNLNTSLMTTRNDIIIELLDKTTLTTANCCHEIESFNLIFDAWMHQPVQEVMAIVCHSVHGATFNEWIKRFTTLIYMLQRR